MNTSKSADSKIIYWHRELPPFGAEPIEEHTVEASSSRVQNSLVHRDELWDRCYKDLMAQARVRLGQELTRLGGDYAHVFDETVDSRRDDITGETWLHGCFKYMLYCRKSVKMDSQFSDEYAPVARPTCLGAATENGRARNTDSNQVDVIDSCHEMKNS